MEQLPNKLMKLNDNYYRIGCNCMDKNCDLDIFIDKMEDTSLWEMSISGTFWCNENYIAPWYERIWWRIKTALEILFTGKIKIDNDVIIDKDNCEAFHYVLNKIQLPTT